MLDIVSTLRESETSDTDNVYTLTGGKLGDLDAIRLILSIYLQGYPQLRMRLQRRLYRICLVRFLAFKVSCRQKLISVLNYYVNH